MTGLITEYMGVGIAADRPATPAVAAGATAFYYATDTPELSVWDGGAWVAVGGGGGAALYGAPWTIPVIGSFTAVNIGAMTATDRDAGIVVYNPATDSFAWRGWLMDPGSATFDLYVRMQLDQIGIGNNSRMGVVIGNNTGPRRVMIGPFSDTSGGFQFKVTRWNGTTYSSEAAYAAGRNALNDAKWMKVSVDATNIKTYMGNGYDWALMGTEAIATFINGGGGAIDRVGFGCQADAGAMPVQFQINSFSLTAPASGGGGQV